MSIRGVVRVAGISSDTPGVLNVNTGVVGLDSSLPLVSTSTILIGVDATISSSEIGKFIEDAAKNLLVSSFGYTFGTSDYVRLIGVI